MSNETSTDRQWRYDIEPQHVVPSTRTMGTSDLDLVRRIAWEAMKGVGVTVKYFKCLTDNSDFYQDPVCTWDTGTLIDGIFEDNPKVKLLKDLGWYSEDEEIRPQILYFPIYSNWVTKSLLDIKANSLIQINYFGQSEPSEFRIMDRKLDSVYGCYTICKLAPERLNNFTIIQKDGAYYLKKAVRDSEECAHEIATDAEIEANGGVSVDDRVYYHSNYDDYAKKIMEG